MPLALMGDPLTSVQYLKKYGLAYHPHAVLQGITLGNDLLTITIKNNQNWYELTGMRLAPQCQVPKTWGNQVKWWANYGRFHVLMKRFQVDEQDWQAAVTEYMLKPDCFDLSIPNRRIMEFCRREGLDCLDSIVGLREEASKLKEKLYMPNGDMHWSPAGNRALVASL